MTTVGIVGIGVYIPDRIMTGKEISDATKGAWTEEAVVNKLGIRQKNLPGETDGTQEMGALAALDVLKKTGTDPMEIDVILCIGEEWKEYPLTTSALYIQDRIGAKNAWGIDLANRCCTTVSTMKIAKDMLISDESINTILIAGGYRNCDLVDYSDNDMSMMYNLGAGGGAIILKKNHDRNQLLGSHIISDGSLSRTAGVEIGGTIKTINPENLKDANMLRLMEPKKMKDRLNEVSMANWYKCIDESLSKSGLVRSDIGYLAILHMKKSGHNQILKDLGLDDGKTIYLENYGHIGQIDQILSLQLGLEEKKIVEGTIVCMVAAGIGYAWAANIIRWGKAE
jgi:3-oxoacyl-[acyl-carrier-protein] synthase-3